jgi:SpoVK/Ycf46/Vps4 family AAA+-type ATPase
MAHYNAVARSGIDTSRVDRLTDIPEITRAAFLPDREAREKWDSIIVPEGWKDRLVNQAIVTLKLRQSVSAARLPLHGIFVLSGPPGTGKTTLAEGLGAPLGDALGERVLFVEVNSHKLVGGQLGKTQKLVDSLMNETIPEAVQDDYALLLIDEVETLATARDQLSLSANPVDVHRAVDAALVGLDRLASSHKKLLVIATTNFQQAIDDAFLSRADLILQMPLPDQQGREQILGDTLRALGESYPRVKQLVYPATLARLAEASEGIDARQLRKSVAMACGRRREVALDPGKLAEDDIRLAIEQVRAVR